MSAKASTSLVPSPTAASAHAALLDGMLDVRDRGHSLPCRSDPDPFTSEDRAERDQAAAACAGCPLLVLCGLAAVASGERWHVWAGVDLTPRTGPGRSGVDVLAERFGDTAAHDHTEGASTPPPGEIHGAAADRWQRAQAHPAARRPASAHTSLSVRSGIRSPGRTGSSHHHVQHTTQQPTERTT